MVTWSNGTVAKKRDSRLNTAAMQEEFDRVFDEVQDAIRNEKRASRREATPKVSMRKGRRSSSYNMLC